MGERGGSQYRWDAYVNYYGARDPYRPLLAAAPSGSWVQLSKCLPQTVLRSDEWYNDYAAKAGIGDIIGTRLFDSPTCTVILSVHRGMYQEPFTAAAIASLRELFDPLSTAARLHGASRAGLEVRCCRAALDQL